MEEVIISPFDSKKRKKINTSNWKSGNAKTARNLGQEYVSTRGRTVPCRRIGEPCGCKLECFNKIGRHNIESIFNDYWKLGSYDIQTIFINNHVTLTNTQGGQRPNLRRFSLTVDGEKVPVCNKAFLSILGEFKSNFILYCLVV